MPDDVVEQEVIRAESPVPEKESVAQENSESADEDSGILEEIGAAFRGSDDMSDDDDDIPSEDNGEDEAASDEENPDASAGEEDRETVALVPQSNTLDMNLVFRAAKLGLTPEDMAGIGGNAGLQSAIAVLERQYARREAEPTVTKDPFEEEIKSLEENGYDDKFVSLAKKISAELKAEREARARLELSVAETERDRLSAARTEFYDRFDAEVSRLDEGFGALLGKGSIHDQKADVAENRKKLFARVSGLLSIDRDSGVSRPLGSVIEEAAYGMFGKNIREIARKDVAAKGKRRSKQIEKRTAAPTTTGDDEQSMEQFIREQMAAAGI